MSSVQRNPARYMTAQRARQHGAFTDFEEEAQKSRPKVRRGRTGRGCAVGHARPFVGRGAGCWTSDTQPAAGGNAAAAETPS